MMIFYGVFAVLTSWVWVYYFKLLGVCKRDKMIFLYSTYVLGFIAYFLFNEITGILSHQLTFHYTNEIVNQLMISIFKFGLFGEILKILPIFLVYGFYKKYLNEPIDVFLLFTVSSLGFSACENMFYSYHEEALHFIDEKIILGTLGEVFCTVPMVYALIKYEFVSKAKKPLLIVGMFFLAVILHSLYDFWIYYERTIAFGFLITQLYFLFLLSFYASTLTNALNFDSEFTYKSVINSKEIRKKIIKFFGILIGVQFFVIGWGVHFSKAIEIVQNIIWFSALIVIIIVFRLTKIKRVHKRWNKFKLQLPFTLYRIDTFNGRRPKYKFKFIGETFNEIFVDNYLGEQCSICPLSKRNSYIMKSRSIFLEKKIFLRNDESFYLIKILNDEKDEFMLLKPKSSGKLLVKRKYAIVALFSIVDLDDIKDKNLTALDFQFREWVFVKHR